MGEEKKKMSKSKMESKLKETPSRKLKGIIGGTWEHVTTLEGCGVYKSYDYGVCRVAWVAKMAICCDGSGGNPYDDPHYQSQTAYYNDGKYLNPYDVPYTVVPPKIVGCVEPVVMGCQGVIINLETGLSTQTITGDKGPADKIGEASCEAASRVGLDPNPNHGGTSEHIIAYMIWPGIAARIDGIQYQLQPS
jgi:hypothetical protein